ncbi:MAG TPA: AraC family transcriptional regulator [Puia sp.]|nr:AraC family transcriptional regulator [Puia sp.]
MPIHITTKKLRDSCVSPLLLEASTGSAFPDNKALQSSGCFSSLLFYDSRCPDFCIRLSNYFLGADVGWHEDTPVDAVLMMQFVLHHSLYYRLEGSTKKVMTEGQYNMIVSPDSARINWFDKANSHTSTLDIHCSPAYLKPLTVHFPELANLLDKRGRGATAQLGAFPANASPMMMRLIKAIVDCEFSEEMRMSFMQSKVSFLLLLALEQLASRPVEKETIIHLKRYDVEKIHEAREYLLLNMENPPTLKELAHKLGMNDYKLKKGYKQIFGTTIFGDFNRERMDKAMQCLLDKDMSITDTAMVTGYQDPPNFIRAFKAYYGSTPGDMRRRYEQLTGKPPATALGRPPVHRSGKRSGSSGGKRHS